jgi:hypothetical protein
MTELSEVVHVEALRVTLNLKGTNEGHYIFPIFELNLTLAQGKQETKMKASNLNAKSPQGNASVARFEMLFHTLSQLFLQYSRYNRMFTSKRSYEVPSLKSIRLRWKLPVPYWPALTMKALLRFGRQGRSTRQIAAP